MSRTYRKRPETYVEYCGKYYAWDFEKKLKKYDAYSYGQSQTIIGFVDYEWESYADEEAKYYSDIPSQSWFRNKKPKEYRKIVNNSRRNRDKRELWKEINFIGYDGLYSQWGCKDSDPTWYW